MSSRVGSELPFLPPARLLSAGSSRSELLSPGANSSPRPRLAPLPTPEQLVASHGQDEAAAAPARLTDPLCAGSVWGHVLPQGTSPSSCSEPSREAEEPSPSPGHSTAQGSVSWLASHVLYCPAQMSEERIKPQADGGGEWRGEESFVVVVLWLQSKAAAALSAVA